MSEFLQVIINGLLMGGVYVIAAVGLTLVFGVMRIINFAHGEFIMIGGYVSYWLFILLGVDPILSIFFAIVLLWIIGVGFHQGLIKKVLHAPRLNQIVLTFSVSIAVQTAALLLFWKAEYANVNVWYGSIAVKLGPFSIGLARLGGFACTLLLTGLLYLWLKRTDTGRALRAIAENQEAAKLMGVNVDWLYLLTVGISASLAGVAGVVTSVIMYTIPTLGALMILKAFTVVILGGLGSVEGAVAGGLVLGLAESLVSHYVPNGIGWSEGVSFTVLVLILIFRPTGFFGKEATLH